jgi:hypothetical protein
MVDTEVDDGAGGSVEVVELDAVEEDDTTGATVDVVFEPSGSVGVLASEHAAPNATNATTRRRTAECRLLGSP